jgi:hypothetical protein
MRITAPLFLRMMSANQGTPAADQRAAVIGFWGDCPVTKCHPAGQGSVWGRRKEAGNDRNHARGDGSRGRWIGLRKWLTLLGKVWARHCRRGWILPSRRTALLHTSVYEMCSDFCPLIIGHDLGRCSWALHQEGRLITDLGPLA